MLMKIRLAVCTAAARVSAEQRQRAVAVHRSSRFCVGKEEEEEEEDIAPRGQQAFHDWPAPGRAAAEEPEALGDGAQHPRLTCIRRWRSESQADPKGFWAYNGIGVVYHRTGRQQEAMTYGWKDLGIKQQLGDRIGQGKAHILLGSAYFRLRQYDAAIECHQAMFDIFFCFTELDDKSGQQGSFAVLLHETV